MRKILWVIPVVAAIGAIALVAIKRNFDNMPRQSANTSHIVLIGASIGQAWHLAEWPSRVKTSRFTAESIAAWQFDKSDAVQEVLIRPSRKFRPTRTYLRSLFQPPPKKADIVILKECSAYFPGDLLFYERSVDKWVSQFQANHGTVILATVIPVTRARARQSPGKQEDLLKYNGWIREYARQHGLRVLDLEVALRAEEPGDYLREEFAAPDGSHLSPRAYVVLDESLRKLLCETTASVTNDYGVRTVAH
jgi:hypothetical protein